MRPDDISAEIFYAAHDAALRSTPENRREQDFVAALTRELIDRLTFNRVEAVKGDQEKVKGKIQRALESVKESRGIEFVITNRTALKAAFEHTVAARMTATDMPPAIRGTGLFDEGPVASRR